ncbi:unnamed protein product [Caenorhabditis nigoni]
MFIRVTSLLLLLLATASFLADAYKTDKILKKIGKKATGNKIFKWGAYNKASFDILPESKLNEIRQKTAKTVISNLIGASSNMNDDFKDCLLFLEGALHSEFKATLCDGVERNAYQFMKYMKQNAKLYWYKWERNLNYTLEETDRNSLNFDISFNMPDKTGTTSVKLDYSVKMVPTFHSERFYHITELKQSGTCANAGDVVPFNPRDSAADDNNATVMWFQGAFAPKFPAWSDNDISNLPTHFLQLLNTSVEINVCHEKNVEEVKYTKEQFLSWYKHFGVMWAVPDSSHFTHQLLDMGDKFISGRVTMKLVMRSVKDAPERDWQFKYVATHYGEDWELSSLNVLCNDAVEYKDESYIHIRKIIAERFVENVEEMEKYAIPPRWWATVEFVKAFTKNGKVKMMNCYEATSSEVTELDMFTYDRLQPYNVKFTKYWFDKGEPSLPAKDEDEFHFKTISQPDVENPEFTYEHDWTFKIKWDEMDQMYYIQEIKMSCGIELKDDQPVDNYMVFNFGGKKHRK